MIDTVFYRKMTVADIDSVLKIEVEAFSLPWTRDSFVQEMTTNLHAYYVVAENDIGQIIGFCGMWMVVDESHITNVAVSLGPKRPSVYPEIMSSPYKYIISL
jgi:ribosomal-protein-alanine N-acetyltransferase